MKDEIMSIDWNNLAKEVHANAVEKGWWGENEQPLETYLMLINCELCEAVEADRKSKYIKDIDLEEYNEICLYNWSEHIFIKVIKGTVEEELADAIIRMLDLSAAKNVDLSHIEGFTVCHMNDRYNAEKTFIGMLMEISNTLTSELTQRMLPMDICIASILAYCIRQKINIMFVIGEKMKYNKLRPYMHGGKKY